jgi:quercetin dioxygenase-like cupin family protein
MTTAIASTRPLLLQLPSAKRWIDTVPGERVAICVRSADVGGAYSQVDLTATAGFAPPLHAHLEADELFNILGGTLRVFCEGETFDAPAGSTFVIPRGARHSWRVSRDGPARMLLTFTPGGVERYFEEVASTQPSDVEALLEKYGTVLAGPMPGI